MPKQQNKGKASFFGELGLKSGLSTVLDRITSMYQADEIPWVVGYSGGKDSTAVLQLVWLALSALKSTERHKPIYVITTDTLVENPIVSAWVANSLDKLNEKAEAAALPINGRLLKPDPTNTFWVNLIGRGYPAPRPKFRWCTERLKIDPSNKFIGDVVKANGEAIVVLGTRKAESSTRAQVMNRLEKQSIRKNLRPNTTLPNSYVFSPIEDWTNDDVWMFLMQVKNPWGHNNKDLLTMYQGASEDGECPLVIDTSTPSCGDSRFGCWVCTLVDKDKSMQAMIQNDTEKEWMLPLLELRDELDVSDDRHLRDFRRMNGAVYLMGDRHVPGPYLQNVREDWLRKVLEAQQYVRQHGPEEMHDLELISLDEMREIRRLWMIEKHEIEDSLPTIYEDVTGQMFPDDQFSEDQSIGTEEIELLKEICGDDDLHFQLTRELLSIEQSHQHLARRAGLFPQMEKAIRRHFYEDADDAADRAKRFRQAVDDAQSEFANELFLNPPEEQDEELEPVLPGMDDNNGSAAANR